MQANPIYKVNQMDLQTADEWLCYCLGMETDETSVARLEQLTVTDWETVIQRANQQSVTPLLYRRLKTLSPGTTIPAGTMQRLRRIYLSNAKRNIRLYHELGQVLGALRENDIPVIALKGAHLAEIVYGNIALRSMSDVDLLVRQTDLAKVEKKLLEMGYTPDERNVRFEQEHFHFAYMLDNAVHIRVEIHWGIANPASSFEIDVDGLWKRSQSAIIAGVKVLSLSPQDLLLHVCLHVSFSDRFVRGLRPLCDVSEILRHYQNEMDWDQVRLCARQWRVGKCVYLTLYLAKELLGTVVPDGVWDVLEPDDLNSWVISEARKAIFTNDKSPSLSKNFVQLWKTGRFRDKVTVFLERVFPSPAIMAYLYSIPSGSPRIYFYYLVHLKDLFVRYNRMTWGMLRHDEEMVTLFEEKTALKEWLNDSKRA